MSGRAFGNLGLAAHGSSRGALRALTAAFATALIVGACGGVAATVSPTPQPTAWQSLLASSTPTSTPTSSPEASATPAASGAPVNYQIVKGKVPLAAPASDQGAAAAGKINDFGLDLLRHLDATGNLCASPASIALALAMVRAGAVGATAAEMDTVLRSFGASGQGSEIVALMKQLANQTIYLDADGMPLEPGAHHPANAKPAVELRVVNQVFSQKGMSLEQPFLDSLSSSFGAGVGLLDFANDPESSRLTINKWASDNTYGRIPNVLQPGDIDKLVRIALANAIYMKAAWETPFDPANTKPRAFTNASGVSKMVPTMAIDRSYQYGAGSGYRVVDLPFTGDSTLSMTIVVPDDMTPFLASLTAAKLATMTGKMSTYIVNLTMPRFSVDTRWDLVDMLKAMGMSLVFDPKTSDLSGITKDVPLYISKVIHQANIDVVEEGVTAAAVTVAIGRAGSAPIQPPKVTFAINKPFLYFIREDSSGVILFMGRVDDPSPAS